MFILNASDVEYCYVSYPQTDLTNILPGLNYRGHLFVKAYNYAKEKFKKAVIQSRQFLDQKIPVVSIVVKEPEGVSVWVHSEQLKLVIASTSLSEKLNSATEYQGSSKEITPGARVHFSLTGETYEVLENNGLFVKTRNLKTGYISTFSLVEITYQQKFETSVGS